MNVRFVCSLLGFVSSLTAEIYAVYLGDIMILTDSQQAINALENRSSAVHKESNLPHNIALLVAPISENFKVFFV